jgi:transcriptional regulator with XRE-family HTH domain
MLKSASVERYRREIGARIGHLREARGLTQVELAKKVGCAKSHISQIENGRGSFSLRVFVAACQALDADVAFVFARVPAKRLDRLYSKFESAVATLGEEAVDFLLSLKPDEMRVLCERAKEAIAYRRNGSARSGKTRSSRTQNR